MELKHKEFAPGIFFFLRFYLFEREREEWEHASVHERERVSTRGGEGQRERAKQTPH